MSALDAIAGIGEVLSWVGLGLGIPLLIAAWIGKLCDGTWVPAELVRIGGAGRTVRWSVAGKGYERELTPVEADRVGDSENPTAYVRARRPASMRLDPFHPGVRATYLIGLALSGAGLLSLAVSMLPLFFG